MLGKQLEASEKRDSKRKAPEMCFHRSVSFLRRRTAFFEVTVKRSRKMYMGKLVVLFFRCSLTLGAERIVRAPIKLGRDRNLAWKLHKPPALVQPPSRQSFLHDFGGDVRRGGVALGIIKNSFRSASEIEESRIRQEG